MRSEYIRINPGLLLIEIDMAHVDLDARGLYLSLLLYAYSPFASLMRRQPLFLHNAQLLRTFGGIRQVRRLIGKLIEAGLIPAHYDPGAWIRRAASPSEYRMLVMRDGERCQKCDATEQLEVDHIVPVVAEGSDAMSNLQLLCLTCNRRKGGRRI